MFTVFYSTESVAVFDEDCQVQLKLQVREVWHYARSNIASCPSRRTGKPARFLPPGFHAPGRLAASAHRACEASWYCAHCVVHACMHDA